MQILNVLYSVLWGVPTIFAILSVGILITVKVGFPQIRLLKDAFRHFARSISTPKSNDGVSSFQALCTSLGATVGVGNIVGVAGAIAVGGPGSLLWIWFYGFFGMAIKYAEAVMGSGFPVFLSDGRKSGGPMFYLSRRMPLLAKVYACFCLLASFASGNAAQINAIMTGLSSVIPWMENVKCRLAVAFGTAIIIILLLLGGMKRIAEFAEILVPFAAGLYILVCLFVVLTRADQLPSILKAVLVGALDPKSVTSGAVFSAFTTFRTGISRGVFSCEAGLGTAAMAHASAETSQPVQQGLMGLTEAFIDTLLICPLTGMAILCSCVSVPYGTDSGMVLTNQAFTRLLGPTAPLFLCIVICLLSFATILGWGLYGGIALRFLYDKAPWKLYVFAQGAVSFGAFLLPANIVWRISEILNGCMILPGILAVYIFRNTLSLLTKDYIQKTGKPVDGGKYENIHQCKSMPAFSHEKVSSHGSGGGEKRQKNLSFKYRSAGSENPQKLL